MKIEELILQIIPLNQRIYIKHLEEELESKNKDVFLTGDAISNLIRKGSLVE